MKSTIIDAFQQKNKGHIPLWFMRQAGRYLPEYMELKAQHGFRTRTHTPDLMHEITVQPLRRYPLDAAIMFSDILTPLEFMGAEFNFASGGPKLEVSGPDVLKSIKPLNTDDMSFVYEGIKLIKNDIGDTPLIGFVGAPFTLASYILEGGGSKDYITTKSFMYSKTNEFVSALTLLADSVANYLLKQIEAGVNAVQIFDSWIGYLNKDDYDTVVFPIMKNMIAKVKTAGRPVILYSQPSSHLLSSLAACEPDVISVDWRIPLHTAVNELNKANFKGSIQGNLDPIVTTLDWQEAKPYVERVLNYAKQSEILDRYIFNVGHGVNPKTKFETLAKIVDFVHQYR